MSIQPPIPSPPPAVRAPHADPFGQFRGAPLNRGRRARYTTVVFGLFLLVALLPFLFDASIDGHEVTPEEAQDVLSTTVLTYEQWQLEFGVLADECDISRDITAATVAQFDCGDWFARVTGMNEVEDYDDAVATALNRSVRVLTFSDTGDMGSHKSTEEAQGINPAVLEDTGAVDVWMSDPYKTGPAGIDGADAQGPQVRNHYAVGFYKPYSDDDAHGMLVTVEVQAETLDDAYAHAERVIATAKDTGKGSDNGGDGQGGGSGSGDGGSDGAEGVGDA